VLGDTFLRSAYVVYDLENNRISLAPTVFNATASNVKEIASGPDGVPGATVVANAVTSLSVSTGGARGPQVTGISGATIAQVPRGLVGAIAAVVGLIGAVGLM